MALSTSLSSRLFSQAGEDLQTALESIENLQDRVIIVDNDKLSYDQAIYKLDEDLIDQCNVVNEAFNDVGTAYSNRIVGVCRTDMFWRVTQITEGTGGDENEYSMVCTRLAAGGYPALTKGGVVGLGSTVPVLNADGSITTYPRNESESEWFITGMGYTFGFEPRNYYGLKYYNEPYSDDIGDTLVGGFIGTITQGQSTITVMQPVGLGLSESLKIGQIIEPQDLDVFTGTAKITGITTGQTDLRVIAPSYVGIGTSLSWVNIITVDSVALRSVQAPLDDGSYGSFDVIDDPDNFADSGREKYSVPKDKDPFLPQTVGIMQPSNIGIGVSVSLDNSGYPTAAMSWDPNLEGYVVEYDSRGRALAGPVEPPKVGSGRCFWRAGFTNYPKTSGGGRAAEDATRTVEASDLNNMYGTLSACSSALEDALTDAVGIASTKETALVEVNTTTNATKVEGLNALRAERNDHYSLPIWGFRAGIGAENETVDRLIILQQHLDKLTIRNIIDS